MHIRVRIGVLRGRTPFTRQQIATQRLAASKCPLPCPIWQEFPVAGGAFAEGHLFRTLASSSPAPGYRLACGLAEAESAIVGSREAA